MYVSEFIFAIRVACGILHAPGKVVAHYAVEMESLLVLLLLIVTRVLLILYVGGLKTCTRKSLNYSNMNRA